MHKIENGSGAGLFILGLAVGAVAGMLLAPKSGREAREHLKSQMQHAAGSARGTMDRMRNKSDDAIEQGRDKAHEVTEKAADAARRVNRAASDDMRG